MHMREEGRGTEGCVLQASGAKQDGIPLVLNQISGVLGAFWKV